MYIAYLYVRTHCCYEYQCTTNVNQSFNCTIYIVYEMCKAIKCFCVGNAH